MSISTESIIRDIAVQQPGTVRVFERFGIDYCCGGKKSVEQVCSELQLSVDQVLEKLEEATEPRAPGEASEIDDQRKWGNATLSRLIQHIVRTHHAGEREEMNRLRTLARKVVDAHGVKMPELRQIESLFAKICDELQVHMLKEEQILFPYIARVEHYKLAGQSDHPSVFNTMRNPIQAMESDHDLVGEMFRELRLLTTEYTPPEWACPSLRGLFFGLHEFEKDLHQHIHLENNILFPRAPDMGVKQAVTQP